MKRTIKEAKVIEVLKTFMKKNFTNVSFHKIHVTPIHNKGFPDLFIIFDGITILVEAKAPGGKPTENQLATLVKMSEAGAKVFLMDCVSDDKNTLNFYDPSMEVLGSFSVKDDDARDKFLTIVNP